MLFCVRFSMMDKAHGCCLILISFLGFVSAIKKLDSLKDLVEAKIDFGKSSPRHGLPLLHWFARQIANIDNQRMRLNFDATRGDYGIHLYRNEPDNNAQRLLPYAGVYLHYYSLGNLNADGANMLPNYMIHNYINSGSGTVGYQERNIDRIIIRSNSLISTNTIIDQIYITQHYTQPGVGGYDPERTYHITNNLLKEIQNLINNNICPSEIQAVYGRSIDQNDLDTLRTRSDPTLASLSLLIHICLPGHNACKILDKLAPYFSNGDDDAASKRHSDDGGDKRHSKRQVHSDDGGDKWQIKLKVTPTRNGMAMICWRGIPSRLLERGVSVMLFPNNNSTSIEMYIIISRYLALGSYDTGLVLRGGLQVRLHEAGVEVVRGSEFHDANGQLPVTIHSYGASLQLFVKNGNACVRLYIKKTFTNWKDVFYYHWIGLYPSVCSDYTTYQWVTKLVKESRSDLEDIPDYDVYVYNFGETINPGDQARLMVKKESVYDTVAVTAQWGDLCGEH